MRSEKRNINKWLRIPAICLTFLFFLSIGCERWSDDIPNGTPTTPEGLVGEGWLLYEQGEYQEAVNTFNQATKAVADELEAYLGMGYAFAQLGELTRAKQNLNNVIGLIPVLVNAGRISSELGESLNAEGNVGLASVNLAERNYTEAVDFARIALELNPNFIHRWIAGFDVVQLKLIMIEAYFGDGQYSASMLLMDEITGDFISQFTQIESVIETQTVVLLEDTWATGVAQLTLNNMNLIYPAVILDADGKEVEVVSYETTMNIVLFRANPIPQNGDQYTVTYLYAHDFGQFLIEMRQAIEALRN